MKFPHTKLRVADLPRAELPALIAALGSAIPGSAWFTETYHDDGCPVEHGMYDAERCTCELLDVNIERLRPVTADAAPASV